MPSVMVCKKSEITLVVGDVQLNLELNLDVPTLDAESHNFAESLTATQLCSKLIYTLHVLSPTLAKTVHKFSHWQKLQLLQVYNDNLTSTHSPPSLLLMCCIMLTY